MARNDNKLLALLGFSATGDVGPWSLYTSRRRAIVFYPRVPALNPPTQTQLVMRARWAQTARRWQMLTPTQRDDWEQASKLARLNVTGFNLYVYYWSRLDLATVRTIEHQTGITLTP